MQDGMMRLLDEWLSPAQAAIFWAVILGMLWYYWEFAPSLYRFAARFPGLIVLVAVLYLMVYGLLGSSLGVDYLFWHDDFPVRSFSSAGATLFLGLVGVIAYYLDPNPWATAERTGAFLKPEEEIKRRVEVWYARRLRRSPAVQGIGTPAVPLGRGDYAMFALNAVVDPVALTPAQAWLDVDLPNTLRLQRFLRAARGPFLLLLLAPAVLPRAFPVPHAAPTGRLELIYGMGEPPDLDVTHSVPGYLLGVLAWLQGVLVGVLVIKLLLRLAQLVHRTRCAEAAIQLGHWFDAALRRTWSRGDRPVAGAGAPRRGVAGDFVGSSHKDCQIADCPGVGCPRAVPAPSRAHPAGCQSRDEVRASGLVFAGVFLGVFVFFGLSRYLRELEQLRGTVFDSALLDLPPAFAICLVLAVLAMGYAGIASLPRSPRLATILGLLVYFGVCNMAAFKNQFERISYESKDIVPLRDRVIDAYDFAPGERDEVKKPGGDRTPLDRFFLDHDSCFGSDG